MPTPADPPETVRHDAERQQFTLLTGNREALLAYRRIDPATLDYHHTFVPSELRGGGVASRLTRFALDYAVQNGLTVLPTCPFVAAYIDAHPQYRSVLAE